MSFRTKASLIIPLLLAFSACSLPNQTESSEPLESSSSENISLKELSSDMVSQDQSSEKSSESSSDGKVYYTVSIYQSYVRRPDAMGRTGIRFDNSVQIESGLPLYRTTEEGRDFYHKYMHPLYRSYGEAYNIFYLFHDQECRDLYEYGSPILSDMTFYYYGDG